MGVDGEQISQLQNNPVLIVRQVFHERPENEGKKVLCTDYSADHSDTDFGVKTQMGKDGLEGFPRKNNPKRRTEQRKGLI